MTIRNSTVIAVSDLPTGVLAQSFERRFTSTAAAPTSGRATMTAIYLYAGTTVTSLTFASHTTALATGSHGWAALYTPGGVLLSQSADDTSVAWAITTAKTFTLGAPQVIATTGWYIASLSIVATTMPTVVSAAVGYAVASMPPVLGGNSSSTALTTTAPGTIALTPNNLLSVFYCQVT